MKFSEYIELIIEQDDDIPLFKKRGGEYNVVGDKNKAIVKAIAEKKMISFVYNGNRKPKIGFDGKKEDSVKPGKRNKVFPVALGVSKRNNMIVRCWIEPPNTSKKGFNKKSSKDIPNWRTFKVSGMSNLKIVDETFDLTKLKGYNPNGDKSMRVVYKLAKFGDISQQSPKPKTKPKPIEKPAPTQPAKPAPTPLAKPTSTKPTPTPTPKPELKPIPTQKKPDTKPTTTPEKLPDIKTKETPEKKPESDKEEMEPLIGLSEEIKRIKSLML